jgi:putative nucleotidyltransferase with HDIG domain
MRQKGPLEKEIDTPKPATDNGAILMQESGLPVHNDFLAGDWKVATSKAHPASLHYVPLPIQNLIPGQKVPFEVLVRIRVAGKTRDQFKICCPSGQEFDSTWLVKLQRAGISRVYFHQQDQALVLKYLNKNLPTVIDDDSLSVKEKADRVADVTSFWVNQFFTDTQAQVIEQLSLGFEYVDHLLSFIRQDQTHRLWLLDIYRHDQTLYSHCLNTSLLAMAFAHYLGWEDRKIRELGRGALLHDIGKTRVPVAVLDKKGSWTEEEWELIRKHPFAGFTMLRAFSIMSREALLIVLQHHENGDGSGYPNGLKMANIHPLAQVMRLIDSFEAMVSPRSWRPGHPPVKALWIMRQDWQRSGMYDAVLLAKLIKFIAGEPC